MPILHALVVAIDAVHNACVRACVRASVCAYARVLYGDVRSVANLSTLKEPPTFTASVV